MVSLSKLLFSQDL